MALTVDIGTFTSPAGGTGDVTESVSGTMKHLTVLSNGKATTGLSADGYYNFGSGVSTSSEFGGSIGAGDGNNPTRCGVQTLNKIIAVVDGTQATTASYQEGHIKTVTATDFTIDFDSGPFGARELPYMCISGGDLSSTSIVVQGTRTSNGLQTLTDAGFTPTAAIVEVFGKGFSAHPGLGEGIYHSIGFIDSSGNQFSAGAYGQDNLSGSSDYNRAFSNTDCIFVPDFAAGTMMKASGALTSTGINLTYSASNGTARTMAITYLAGPQFEVVTDTERTTNGTKSTAGSFQAVGGWFATTTGGTTSVAAHVGHVVGVSNGTTHRCVGMKGRDATSGALADSWYETDSVIKMFHIVTDANVGTAVPSFPVGGGVDMAWTNVDGGARHWGALLIGAGTGHAGPAVGARRLKSKLQGLAA